MLALNQFIYKFSLDSKLNNYLFFAGLFIKLFAILLIPSSISNDLFAPFVSYFLDSNFQNPYEFFSNQSLEPFPYPLGMLYLLSIPIIAVNLIITFASVSVLLKLPVLFFDLLLFFIIKSWLNHKSTTKLILIFWMSPVLFYISYFYGQLDIIPISILFLSLYFLFKNKLAVSSIILGIALSTKTMIAIVVPFLIIFLISQKQRYSSIFVYLLLLFLKK